MFLMGDTVKSCFKARHRDRARIAEGVGELAGEG